MHFEMPKPETVEEYMVMVKQFSGLVAAELKMVEEDAQKGDVYSVVQRLSGLVSIINTLGYLRGQDGFFLDSRPNGLAGEYQRQLYAMEDEVETRLWKLIEFVCNTAEGREQYLSHMHTYYLDARTPKE
jgi:hypothetical protein